MEKIVLIGASGFVGSAILMEALKRGHQVTAVVRNPDKITVSHPLLIVKKADVSLADTVAIICRGADAVISAYNPGWSNPDIYEETLIVYPAILEGVKKSGVKRFLMVGGAGYLFVAPGVRVVDTGVIPNSILGGVRSLGKFYLDTLLIEKDIDWVFFAPAGSLVPGSRTGKFRLGKDNLVVDTKGDSKISIEDYAMAMVDELEKPAHHCERFTIGY